MQISPSRAARATAALLAVSLIAGCTSGQVADSPAVGDNRPSATKTADATPAEPINPTFGETFEWSDGLSVTVSAPSEFVPSSSALAGPAASYLAFTVTLVNGTDQNYEPGGFFATMQSGNAEAEQVFDIEQEFSGGPQTVLLPGREVEFKIGFGVNDPTDLVLQVMPDFTRDSAIFTS